MTSRLHPWLLVALLWVVALLNYIDRQVAFSMFPLLRSDLNASDVELGLISTVFLFVYGLLSPFAGYLADRFGRVRVILFSLLVWSAVTFLTGQVRGIGEMLWTRAL
ncbi:MAG: MFS transporter, partial [Bryobacteraceae bacterium]